MAASRKSADDDERSAGFHLLTRLWLQHLGTLAMKIGPAPGVLGLKQLAHRSPMATICRRQRRNAIADGYSGWRGHG